MAAKAFRMPNSPHATKKTPMAYLTVTSSTCPEERSELRIKSWRVTILVNLFSKKSKDFAFLFIEQKKGKPPRR
jgi:hypothetical protein